MFLPKFGSCPGTALRWRLSSKPCMPRNRSGSIVRYPLPTNGMPVAITVMVSTLASSGRLAM
jgi:hypothetical protein